MKRLTSGTAVVLCVLLGMAIASGCSKSSPPATTASQSTENMPPEVIYDPESAMQKYGRPDRRN
jgi:hypothetical protein